MTTEFFDIEMQRMIVHTANINEINRRTYQFYLMNHIFESIPSIQDCVKTIIDKYPIINNRSAKICPELDIDSRHVAIDILQTLVSPPKQQKYMNDLFDNDDLESQRICYENMFCRENRKRFMKEEEEEEKQ